MKYLDLPKHLVASDNRGELLPTIEAGMVFTLRGRTFRVTQVIPKSNVVYLMHRTGNGRNSRWSGWDRAGDLRVLQIVLAEEGITPTTEEA